MPCASIWALAASSASQVRHLQTPDAAPMAGCCRSRPMSGCFGSSKNASTLPFRRSRGRRACRDRIRQSTARGPRRRRWCRSCRAHGRTTPRSPWRPCSGRRRGGCAARRTGCGHCAGSFTLNAPRMIWSRSMLSNSALKLPSPKPSSFLRWMNSKNTGPICGFGKDLQQQARIAFFGRAIEQDAALLQLAPPARRGRAGVRRASRNRSRAARS